jgi:lysophospholipase L1-like esterase
MRTRTFPFGLRLSPAGSALALALLAFGCSSPTSPSTPPTSPPPPTTPPVAASPLTISCPANVTATGMTSPVTVSFTTPMTSGGVAPVQVSCTRPSPSTYTAGSTQVQCTARDASGVSTSCGFLVNVTVTPPRLSRTRFMAFGDSITAGEISVPASVAAREGGPHYKFIIVPSASYPTQLLQMLRARYTDQTATLEVVNSGRPGEWAQDGSLRLPGVMSSVRPEAVLLLEGYNDLGAAGTTAGINNAILAIDRMAKEIRGRGARVFLATLPPPGPNGAKGIPLSQVTTLNERIKVTATGEGAVLVDAYAVLSADIPRYIGADGLHLTEAGYARLADLFFNAIRTDLEVR